MADENLYNDIMSQFENNESAKHKVQSTERVTEIDENGYTYDTKIPDMYMDDVEEVQPTHQKQPEKKKKEHVRKSEKKKKKKTSTVAIAGTEWTFKQLFIGILTLLIAGIFLLFVIRITFNVFSHVPIQNNLDLESMFGY